MYNQENADDNILAKPIKKLPLCLSCLKGFKDGFKEKEVGLMGAQV